MTELLTRVDPEKYRTYVIEKRGKMVLYVKLKPYMEHYRLQCCSG
jgi:hypothetical protein